MKQKGPLYIHGPVHVFNQNENLDVLIKDPGEKPLIDTADNFEAKPPQWLKRIADIIIFLKGKNPHNPENQVDSFGNSTITIIVDIPDNIIKEARPETLKLYYYDKDPERQYWVAFAGQQVNILGKIAVVTLTNWIKDPPIGWGGDHPE